ncbi:hypothetical protein LSTR_LSTR002881 [Laodelphax striatellus]|uniref:C2H2-type domain-containing protein n=1 Tax=Laodelphax striatellus TaxID=195883 RepID=A0A482XVZ3_LAOST|nr:hypothetical protein LSTR_LSTR002881 [Laodelphax striatellus]
MIESEHEQDIEEVEDDSVNDNDDDKFIFINDVDLVDDSQAEDDDDSRIIDPIVYHQAKTNEYKKEQCSQENDYDDDDDEGCILLSDVILQDDDYDNNDNYDSELDEELAEYEWTALNSIDYDDDDDGHKEEEAKPVKRKNPHGVDLKAVSDPAPKLKPVFDVPRPQDSCVPRSKNKRCLMLSEVSCRTVTAADNSGLAIGELVPPPSDQNSTPGQDVRVSRCFYKCLLCEHKSGSRHKLLVHYRKHSREKPFPCKYCGKLFRQNHHLTDHARMHTGERPYKCKNCDKSFVRLHHLKRHSTGPRACKVIVE